MKHLFDPLGAILGHTAKCGFDPIPSNTGSESIYIDAFYYSKQHVYFNDVIAVCRDL